MKPARKPAVLRWGALSVVLLVNGSPSWATPANKAALDAHYDRFLNKSLSRCTTCHLPSDKKDPESLDEFPHNPFGHRLRLVGKEPGKRDIATRLLQIAAEDSDQDGASNQIEILLGRNPGDPKDVPDTDALATAPDRAAEFAQFMASYRWRPFEPVQRPPLPRVSNARWIRDPIDAFIAAGHQARKLTPRAEATKPLLLRRAYIDLIGLNPTPAEQRAFAQDKSPHAYERLVDRLLDDPRYGERWGRHWMDIWRYSDWAGWSGGNQIRDSKPHIWRWRDWIVESLNADKGYDRMVLEMLAADELAPEDNDALRATGFLVRNYKMLSREQWLEDTIKHTSQAFLGLTVGCAKCHDHMSDGISQAEYYQLRAIFEPHFVRTDRVPGELDLLKAGLVRAFDTATNARTYFYLRGDERRPDTNRLMQPGIPNIFRRDLDIHPISLPAHVAHPDKRDFVIRDTVAASERKLAEARQSLAKLATNSDKLAEKQLQVAVAEASHAALLAVLAAEKLEDNGKKGTDGWKEAAISASRAQRKEAALEAKLKLLQAKTAQSMAQSKADEATKKSETEEKAKKEAEKAAKEFESARKKVTEAEKALTEAETKLNGEPSTAYKPRPTDDYPEISTGRRLAFARWLVDSSNPLAARVAVNHIWLRHFGRGLVATPENFGRSGTPPSHPELLDWLAAEFMASGWSMKHIHRLILTSSTYRMASTGDDANTAIDPDNIYFWRMPSRRLEAELVRDNLLHAAGTLDPSMGGPEIDHKLGLTSTRRSLYLRIAPEKEVEFLKIFDGPSVTECYQRRPSVMPQQALALANSELAIAQARALASSLASAGDDEFVFEAFRRILARAPNRREGDLCRAFLKKSDHARENLLLVLFNHNDFITVR